MDFKELTNKSIDEMYEFMQTEEFTSKVDKDASVAMLIEYSKILLTNYHNELSSLLKSKGIDL